MSAPEGEERLEEALRLPPEERPAYMNPDQAALTSLDIDTRSAIHVLGVLLFELFTDKTLFDPRELLSIGLDEMHRTIREKGTDRPLTPVSTLPAQELSGRRSSSLN